MDRKVLLRQMVIVQNVALRLMGRAIFIKSEDLYL